MDQCLQRIDDAIEHLNELLRGNDFSCDECRSEHVQLREWLIALKDISQRYQQLEQVAKEMFGWIMQLYEREIWCSYLYKRDLHPQKVGWIPQRPKEFIDMGIGFKKQLIDCGVNLDGWEAEATVREVASILKGEREGDGRED